jgi:hypothetical protein
LIVLSVECQKAPLKAEMIIPAAKSKFGSVLCHDLFLTSARSSLWTGFYRWFVPKFNMILA